MKLKRALFLLALVLLPPAAGLALASGLGWLKFEWSLGGVLIFMGAFGGWIAGLGALAEIAGFFRREDAAPGSAPGPPVEPPAVDVSGNVIIGSGLIRVWRSRVRVTRNWLLGKEPRIEVDEKTSKKGRH